MILVDLEGDTCATRLGDTKNGVRTSTWNEFAKLGASHYTQPLFTCGQSCKLNFSDTFQIRFGSSFTPRHTPKIRTFSVEFCSSNRLCSADKACHGNALKLVSICRNLSLRNLGSLVGTNLGLTCRLPKVESTAILGCVGRLGVVWKTISPWGTDEPACLNGLGWAEGLV